MKTKIKNAFSSKVNAVGLPILALAWVSFFWGGRLGLPPKKGLGTLYTKKKAASFNPYFSLGLQMFISSILLFAYNGATGISVTLGEIPINTRYAIAYLVIVGSLITFSIFIIRFNIFRRSEQYLRLHEPDCSRTAGCHDF